MTDTTSLRELPAKWQADAFAVVAAYGPGSDYGQALQMCIDELEAALSALAEPQAGEWVWVRVAPTPEQIAAGRRFADDPHTVWMVMLAALNAPSPASRARPEAQGEKCPHCGAPCRKEVLMRGGDNGWGDDESRTVYRFSPPADRTPGEVGEDDAKLVDALADHAYSDAADGRSCPSDATEQAREALIRRLAAVAPAGMVAVSDEAALDAYCAAWCASVEGHRGGIASFDDEEDRQHALAGVRAVLALTAAATPPATAGEE